MRYFKRKKSTIPDSLRDALKMIGWVTEYRWDYLLHHKNLAHDFKKKVAIIQNKSEMKKFLSKF